MTPLLWTMLGLAVGVLAMVPVMRGLVRRVARRAREAERRARRSERLAELGSMTGGLAHEIKNPLSTIGLNAQLLSEALLETDLPADEKERLRRRLDALAREVERLKGILTDFLRFAGRMRLDPQRRDLVAIVDSVSDFFHPQCDQAGIVLRTQLPRSPVYVSVDEDLLKQALLNLMINATQAMAKMSPENADPHARRGDLMLRVEADTTEARVEVIDTGPGIAPDRLSEIFHPYVSDTAGGSGLGLPTARRIVEEHSGRLTVHSERGRGSSFVIHLPLEGAPGVESGVRRTPAVH